jgi:hypothetical protein
MQTRTMDTQLMMERLYVVKRRGQRKCQREYPFRRTWTLAPKPNACLHVAMVRCKHTQPYFFQHTSLYAVAMSLNAITVSPSLTARPSFHTLTCKVRIVAPGFTALKAASISCCCCCMALELVPPVPPDGAADAAIARPPLAAVAARGPAVEAPEHGPPATRALWQKQSHRPIR